MLRHRRSPAIARPLPPIAERFGIRSLSQVTRDLGRVVRGGLGGSGFQLDVRSVGLLRPDLSLPAYAGLVPDDGLVPVFNLFDRHAGGTRYSQRVSRRTATDFRGGRLSYDEHDGTDFVCPIGTPLCAAAPGIVVAIRDQWLRGGLSVSVDHGAGVVTQYTHCARATVGLGQPVRRGDPVALSGAAGYDLVQFFPWIPPHIHFMVYVDGRPVDPYARADEPDGPGRWLDGRPGPCRPLAGDRIPDASPVDEHALARVIATCRDAGIADEIRAASASPAFVAAVLEDALAHQRSAWPDDVPTRVRPPLDAARRQQALAVRLSLPLPADAYAGARFADTWLTLALP